MQFGAKEAKRRWIYTFGAATAETTAAIANAALTALLLIVYRMSRFMTVSDLFWPFLILCIKITKTEDRNISTNAVVA